MNLSIPFTSSYGRFKHAARRRARARPRARSEPNPPASQRGGSAGEAGALSSAPLLFPHLTLPYLVFVRCWFLWLGFSHLLVCCDKARRPEENHAKECRAIRPAMSQQPDVYLEPKWLRWLLLSSVLLALFLSLGLVAGPSCCEGARRIKSKGQ